MNIINPLGNFRGLKLGTIGVTQRAIDDGEIVPISKTPSNIRHIMAMKMNTYYKNQASIDDELLLLLV